MTPNPLPIELRYLEPILRELEQIEPDKLNEDVDGSSLEIALRERIKGLKPRDAVSRLTEDHNSLVNWQKQNESSDGPTSWVAGYLMRPRLIVEGLLAPPLPPSPTVKIDMAEGWSSKPFPHRLDLTMGEQWCVIAILENSDYIARLEYNEYQEEHIGDSKSPWAKVVWSKTSVIFGPSQGNKYSSVLNTNPILKTIEYLLQVEGGFVKVSLGTKKGGNFDESVLESKLHSLKVIPPKQQQENPS